MRVSVGLRNTKECSMSYRQSEMYKLTTYLKDLPLQSVSSKKNLQVVDKFRQTCELFLCSKNKRGRVGVQIPCIPFFVRWFTWKVVYLENKFQVNHLTKKGMHGI